VDHVHETPRSRPPDDAVYLDGAAATPPLPRAADATRRALQEFGDPRSPNRFGREAEASLERALATVAAGLGADQDEVHPGTSGSHANALAVLGTRRADSGRIVVFALEHASVTEAALASGLDVVEIPAGDDGRIDVDRFAAEVARPDTVFASVQHVSPDLGTMQPVAECARIARQAGVRFHTDACQSAASLPIDAGALGVDLLTVSSHKAYGPPGAGVLFARRGIPVDPFLRGAARPGPAHPGPNVAALAGMAEAFLTLKPEIADLAGRLWSMSARLRTGLDDSDAGLRVLGHPTHRVPHLVSVAVSGADRETLFMTLEDRGLLVGEARAQVLARAGLTDPADVVVRLGLTRDTTDADVDRVLDVLPDVARRLRGIGRRAEARFGSGGERA
jgi:cysteine desulfurase